jgi:hypothetical protein
LRTKQKEVFATQGDGIHGASEKAMKKHPSHKPLTNQRGETVAMTAEFNLLEYVLVSHGADAPYC